MQEDTTINLHADAERYKKLLDLTLRFADITLKAPDLKSLIIQFESVMNNPIIVYDEFFNIMISTDHRVEDYDRDPTTLEKCTLTNLFYYKQRVVFQTDELQGKCCTRLIFPVLVDGMAKGYLTIFDTLVPYLEMDFLSLELFSNFMLVEMKRLLDLKKIEAKYVSDFLYDVIYRKTNKREDIKRRAKILNISEQANYCIIAVDMLGTMKDTRLDINGYITRQEYMSERMMNNIGNFMHTRFPQDIVTKFDRTVIILHKLHQNKDEEKKNEIKSTCQWLLSNLQRIFEGMVFHIGIGTQTDDLEGIAASYHHAVSAISYGKILYRETTDFIVSDEESSLLKVFGKLKETDSLHDIIPKALLSIRQWDEDYQSDFYNTLKVYLDCNCNAKKASEKLYIHYKTMLYRLEKIERQFAIDLDDRISRLHIELGIQMLDIMEIEAPSSL